MKKAILFICLLISLRLVAKENINNLNYAEIEITVPKNCIVKSEFEILDCNDFSAQWLFLNEEMVKQKINEQLKVQIEKDLKYKKKEKIEFISQNQKFTGTKYNMKNGEFRIIGFGRINNIPLILNLGFNKDPISNSNLTDFEKKFITF